jgi:hypothetical protein
VPSTLSRQGPGHGGIILFRRSVSTVAYGKQARLLLSFWQQAETWDLGGPHRVSAAAVMRCAEVYAAAAGTFGSISLFASAYRVRPATSWMFSLFITCWRCFSTVLMLIPTMSAISLLV